MGWQFDTHVLEGIPNIMCKASTTQIGYLEPNKIFKALLIKVIFSKKAIITTSLQKNQNMSITLFTSLIISFS